MEIQNRNAVDGDRWPKKGLLFATTGITSVI